MKSKAAILAKVQQLNKNWAATAIKKALTGVLRDMTGVTRTKIEDPIVSLSENELGHTPYGFYYEAVDCPSFNLLLRDCTGNLRARKSLEDAYATALEVYADSRHKHAVMLIFECGQYEYCYTGFDLSQFKGCPIIRMDTIEQTDDSERYIISLKSLTKALTERNAK